MKSGKQFGVSLVEVMTTVAVMALLAAFAAPNVQKMLQNNRTESVATQLQNSLYLARSDAAKTGYRTTFCPVGSDQNSCGTDYSNGWIIFSDHNDNGVLDSTPVADTNGDGVTNALDDTESVLFVYNNDSAQFKITMVDDDNAAGVPDANQAFRYYPNGMSSLRNRKNPKLTIIHSQSQSLAASIRFEQSGRIHLCITARDGHC
ncbi:MAG: hypothetical protein CR991_01810 [Proteobacteria bacterium]|nr:MAG: hypothetical protein CR991_01810 [Pseudomonadota bacterium]